MPEKLIQKITVSTHSHPKAAAHKLALVAEWIQVSTHSHPKAAAFEYSHLIPLNKVSTHSHPKAAAQVKVGRIRQPVFQHTATRRRLP